MLTSYSLAYTINVIFVDLREYNIERERERVSLVGTIAASIVLLIN